MRDARFYFLFAGFFCAGFLAIFPCLALEAEALRGRVRWRRRRGLHPPSV